MQNKRPQLKRISATTLVVGLLDACPAQGWGQSIQHFEGYTWPHASSLVPLPADCPTVFGFSLFLHQDYVANALQCFPVQDANSALRTCSVHELCSAFTMYFNTTSKSLWSCCKSGRAGTTSAPNVVQASFSNEPSDTDFSAKCCGIYLLGDNTNCFEMAASPPTVQYPLHLFVSSRSLSNTLTCPTFTANEHRSFVLDWLLACCWEDLKWGKNFAQRCCRHKWYVHV